MWKNAFGEDTVIALATTSQGIPYVRNVNAYYEKGLIGGVEIICRSFMTVADEFGFTIENAPRFTAFATTEERLVYQMEQEQRQMFAYYDDGRIVGYYSLLKQNEKECELNNLCVLAEYRHKKIGEQLLKHAFAEAEKMGCSQMNIGIVEENVKLRRILPFAITENAASAEPCARWRLAGRRS